MDKKDSLSKKRSEAAQKRWGKNVDKQEVNAKAKQKQCKSNAIEKQGKERKGKENKVNESKEIKKSSRFSFPSQKEIFEYMHLEKEVERKVALKESQKLFDYYESVNWYVGKKKMANWKSAVSGWINRMTDFNKPEPQKKRTASMALREKLNM